jgi:hypothetical protein
LLRVMAIIGAILVGCSSASCDHWASGSGSGKTDRSEGGSGVVSPAGWIGELRIDHSTPADIRRIAGAPAFAGGGSPDANFADILPSYEALGYGCSRERSQGRGFDPGGAHSAHMWCRTVYFVLPKTGKLAGFWTDSPEFRTVKGSRPGMRQADSDRLEGAHPFVGALTGIDLPTRTATLFIDNAGCRPGANLNTSPCLGGHVTDLIVEGRHPVGLLEDGFPSWRGKDAATKREGERLSTSAQALRTCVDRWNQANMLHWGPAFVNVSVRRLDASETAMGVRNPVRPRCVMSFAFERRDRTFACVINPFGAYDCPLIHEPVGPPLRNKNATTDRRGVLKLDAPLKGMRATPRLAWHRYPHRDGYIEPWTRAGRLRRGLKLAGTYHGFCSPGSEETEATSELRCLFGPVRYVGRFDPCFPPPGDWNRRGRVVACASPGATTFTRFVIIRRS